MKNVGNVLRLAAGVSIIAATVLGTPFLLMCAELGWDRAVDNIEVYLAGWGVALAVIVLVWLGTWLIRV